MWLSRYPRQIEIYVHDFIKYLIEDEYGITAKPSTSVNPVSNAVLGRIHQVIGNLVRTFNVQRTYVDKNDPLTGILAASVFSIHLTTNRQRDYSPGQLIFGRYMILPIKYRAYWEIICQVKQRQTKRDNDRKNRHRVDYDYKVRDEVALTKHTI